MNAMARFLVGLCLAVIAVFGAGAAVMSDDSFSLEILWSSPIRGAQPPGPPGTVTRSLDQGEGLSLVSGARSAGGQLVFLGQQVAPGFQAQVLLVDVERRGLDGAEKLRLREERPVKPRSFLDRLLGANTRRQGAFVNSLAVGRNGEIWVAGSINGYMDIASSSHSDAYLARLDEHGSPIWEKTYGDGGARNISNLSVALSGDLILFGADGSEGWLAMASPDGRLLWETRIGAVKGGMAAWGGEGRIVVAAIEATGSAHGGDYRDHVTVWVVNGSGEILAKTRIRADINNKSGYWGGAPHIIAANGAIYVASVWDGWSEAKPVMISKVALDGRLL